MLRESCARLREHPKLLWIIPLGATLLVPIIFAALTVALAQEIAPLGGIVLPLYSLALLFAAAFVLAGSYFHALVINAARRAGDEDFGFLDIFRGARDFYGRTILLNLLFSVPLIGVGLLGFTTQGPVAVAWLVVAGALLLACPFLFLRAPVYLAEMSLGAALKKSLSDVRSKQHYVRWGFTKLSAAFVTAVFFLGAYGVIAEANVWLQVGLVVVYFLLLLNGLLAPAMLFVALVLYGAQNVGHFALVLVLQLVYFLQAHVLLGLDR